MITLLLLFISLWTLTFYCYAYYKYSQPFAETVSVVNCSRGLTCSFMVQLAMTQASNQVSNQIDRFYSLFAIVFPVCGFKWKHEWKTSYKTSFTADAVRLPYFVQMIYSTADKMSSVTWLLTPTAKIETLDGWLLRISLHGTMFLLRRNELVLSHPLKACSASNAGETSGTNSFA